MVFLLKCCIDNIWLMLYLRVKQYLVVSPKQQLCLQLYRNSSSITQAGQPLHALHGVSCSGAADRNTRLSIDVLKRKINVLKLRRSSCMYTKTAAKTIWTQTGQCLGKIAKVLPFNRWYNFLGRKELRIQGDYRRVCKLSWETIEVIFAAKVKRWTVAGLEEVKTGCGWMNYCIERNKNSEKMQVQGCSIRDVCCNPITGCGSHNHAWESFKVADRVCYMYLAEWFRYLTQMIARNILLHHTSKFCEKLPTIVLKVLHKNIWSQTETILLFHSWIEIK